MQKRFLFFSLSFLLFILFSACDREESLLITEIEEPEEVVVIEEETPISFRTTVDDDEYVDVIGQVIDMDNGWYMISNSHYAEYECSSTTSGYSFNGTGDGQPGGNPAGLSFTIFVNVTPGSPQIPLANFFVPDDNGVFGHYNNLCNNGQGGFGSFELNITSNNGERIAGTFEATVYLLFDPVTFEQVCATPASIERTVTGAFDLPLETCG